MDNQNHDLDELAYRAERGDKQAQALLRRAVERQLDRIVRCTLRSGRSTNPLGKRVLEEARRVGPVPTQAGQEAPEHVVSLVVRRLGAALSASLAAAVRPPRWSVDTVLG